MTTTPRTPRTRLAALAALAVTACGLTACGDSDPAPAADPTTSPTTATSAATTAPITLRLGTDDTAETPGGAQIEHFAQEVADESGGAITIQPVWHADGGQSHWDQAVAHMVVDGDLDLAMVPSRAWDDLGVTSLTALNAPFLVTTDTLTATVLTDHDLVNQLTSGLPDAGVSALGLFPEGLRHPFGFAGALGGPADYQGGTFRSPYSRTTEAVFKALGATMTDDDADPTTMVGAESSYRLTPSGTATGNVTFYPKVNSLVVNQDVRSGLTDAQLDLLQRSADATQAWVLDTLPSDTEAAETYCSEAGHIGAATQADLDALAAATRPVVDDLRKDPTTATLIDEIQAQAVQDPPALPVTSCAGQIDNDGRQVDGTYTVSVTGAAARAAGATDQDAIDENVGDFVLTLADGTWKLEQHYTSGPKKGQVFHGAGGYTLEGKHLTWYWTHEPGGSTEMEVLIAGDATLHFSNVVDGGDATAQALSEAFFKAWRPQG